MSRRRLLILGLLVIAVILGGLFLVWKQKGDSRELDRLIAALPPKTPSRATLSDLGDYAGGQPPVARLIELLEEAGRYGAGAKLGDRSYEMARRTLVLARIEEQLLADDPDQATREIITQGLRRDLDRDSDWPATLRAHRDDWFRWLAGLREGEFDESEVLGPPSQAREILGGRRLGDGAILRGWRSIGRFFDRAEEIPLSREDFDSALDALVETPADRGEDPVTDYFAGFATRDLKSTRRLLMEIRKEEERLLRSLE